MRRLAVLGLATGLAGLIAAQPARVDAVLCRTKRRALVVRDACKAKETPADLAVQGVAAPKGDAGAAGASVPSLRAFDANGAFVGWVNAFGVLFMQVGDRVFFLEAGTDGFRSDGRLRFESTDCSGPALVQSFGDLVTDIPVHGLTAYYAGDPIQAHAIRSTLEVTTPQSCTGAGGTYDGATGLCCRKVTFSIASGPAIPIDLSGFAPPFRLEIAR